jgi:hypothetical protein
MMNLGITGKAKEYIKQRLSALKIISGIALNGAIQANDARSNALQWHHGDKSTRDHASRHNQGIVAAPSCDLACQANDNACQWTSSADTLHLQHKAHRSYL